MSLDGETDEIEELRLADFSVKKYLISDRIRTGPASRYTIEQCAEGQIGATVKEEGEKQGRVT
jgi:hypothetical protein